MSAETLTTLARIYLLGLLFSILPGSWAQVQLLESGGKVTHEGQSVTLTCKASGFKFKDYAMSWHWTPNRSERQFVASISPQIGSQKDYKSSIQGRALITRNNGAHTVSLTLRQLRKEDSGIYFCARLTMSVTVLGLRQRP